MTGTEVVACVIVPDLCVEVLVGWHVWRHHYDEFGGTTRSSQLYGRRLLRIASRRFHFGSSQPSAGTSWGC